ncbi:hypothetical protein [Clostridium sp. LIBA-8841]|uniref:hypothetical protein n=1 Tax=Clostridium sp. LIBA-8841 TaxID=2987530 RepID=UPI002AC3DFE0|nr:hypothetical protein [Clostridium sp. LIBA-8841]MDZ5254809.1 hypothetical protein [Clostridium sp. LIBA-8841]
MIKKSKERFEINERIWVNTRKAMKDAIDDKYKTIIVTGEIVDDVKREVNY